MMEILAGNDFSHSPQAVYGFVLRCFRLRTNMNSVLDIIYSRRAVRKYKDVELDSRDVELLLDAGRMAPSAVNRQPWRFYVVTNPTLIKTISLEIAPLIAEHFHLSHRMPSDGHDDPIFHGAPCVIFISAPKDNEWAQLDIGMCAENMMLAAKAKGLDSCPVGLGKFVEKTRSYRSLGVPDDEHIVISLIFGYGDEKPEVHPRRRDNAYYIGQSVNR